MVTSRLSDHTVQGSLFDDPRPVQPADPNVEPAARPRLSRQCRAVLLLLRSGPCTARDLSTITHRFGGRIWDLRKAGCEIRCDYEPASGVSTYTLTHEPGGLT